METIYLMESEYCGNCGAALNLLVESDLCTDCLRDAWYDEDQDYYAAWDGYYDE